MDKPKRNHSFYMSDETWARLEQLAEADYNRPARYLEKMIDTEFARTTAPAQATETPALMRHPAVSSGPRGVREP